MNNSQPFPLLESVTRPTVETAAAAYYLNRQPQTLRTWACFENGPIRPIRINGRLAWRVSDIRNVLGIPTPANRNTIAHTKLVEG